MTVLSLKCSKCEKLLIRTSNDDQCSVVAKHQCMNLFDSTCLTLKEIVKKQRINWAEGIKSDNYSRVKCKHLQELLKAREKSLPVTLMCGISLSSHSWRSKMPLNETLPTEAEEQSIV